MVEVFEDGCDGGGVYYLGCVVVCFGVFVGGIFVD